MEYCPEVAILLATYNGEKYLEEQLDSLLSQKTSKRRLTVPQNHNGPEEGVEGAGLEKDSSKMLEYKIYIHDDGSVDNTVAIIHSYAEKYPDKISLIEGPPTGSAKNNFFYLIREVSRSSETLKASQRAQNDKRTREIQETQGTWIDHENQGAQNRNTPRYYFFCDQDDVWLEDKLQVELAALKQIEKNESNRVTPSLVWCDMKVVDDQLNEISQSFSSYSHLTPDELDIDRCIMHGKAAGCSMACNAQLISLCCEIQETEKIIMHDWALFLIARIAGRLKYIDKPLALYRQHDRNSLGATNEGKLQMVAGIIGRLVSMRQLRATQANLKRYIAQVASLQQVKDVYRSQQELIDGANEFMRMNRIDKLRFVNRFKLYRHRGSKLWSAIAAFLI